MLILDTNVLSILMKDHPDEIAELWLNRQVKSSIWTTTITVFEVRYGIERLPLSKRRKNLENIFTQVFRKDMENRILDFDISAADCAAALAAKRSKIGKIMDFRDTAIAGIAIAHHAKLVTRNTRHFEDLDIEIINPWKFPH